MEPWKYYLDQLRSRAERIPQGAPGANELMAELAHDAYERTTNHLTEQGWDEERALTVTRLFGQTVKEWLARGQGNWEALNDALAGRYAEWTQQRGDR
jgi:hypothetical protein